MEQKTVYQLDAAGLLVGATTAFENPRSEGSFLIPAGCVEVPPPAFAAGERARWTGESWVVEEIPSEPVPPPASPTAADVAIERDRRLSAGFDFDFGDSRGVHRFGTTDADLRGWREVTDICAALLAKGEPAIAVRIATDTGETTVTAADWQSVLLSAGAFRQPIWRASFALQAMDPIPEDYADDAYWSAAASEV